MTTLHEILKTRPNDDWASLIGCKPRTVASWIYGERVPSIRAAHKIAAVSGVSLSVIRPDVFSPADNQVIR